MKLERKIHLYYTFKFFQNMHFFGAVLVPFFTVWANMTEQTALLVQSWFMLSVTLLELPTGIVADRFGRKISLMLGAVSATVGLILYGLYANIYLFLICESILALAMSLISGADEAWLIDTLNEHKYQKSRSGIIGKSQSFMFAGMIVGTILGSLIAQKISINATMYLSAIPSLLLLIVASKLPEPQVHKAPGEIFRWQQGFASLKVLLTNHDLRILAANLVLVSVSAYFVLWLYQPLLQRIGINLAWFGVIHTVMIGVEILVAHHFDWFEKRLGLIGYLRVSALLTTFGFLLLLWRLNLATIVIFVVMAGGFGLTRRYFAVDKFHEFIDSTYRASISSSFSLLLRLSTALANIFVGWLFVRSEELTLLILGLLPLVAVVFVPLNRVIKKNK